MRAAVQVGYGAIHDAVVVREVPVPSPRRGEVLVRVEGATLNRKDLFALQNLAGPGIRARPPLPHVNGTDGWGTVAATGDGVQGWTAGDRVIVYPGLFCGTCEWCERGEQSACVSYGVLGEQVDGTHAEYVVVPARNLERVPDGVPAAALAATCGSWLTAWRALVVVARLQPGEALVVVGASGGVGTAAIRIGSLAGARVVALVGGPARRPLALEAGADVAIEYLGGRFREAVSEATRGRGADVVLDSVGAATWRDSINVLRPFGRLVICGATSGDGPDISIREIYQQHRRILGAPLGSRRDFRDLAGAVFEARLQPVVHATFPLERVHEGLRLLESREVFGKVVITP